MKKGRDNRNCNRNLQKRINICILVMRKGLLFLFLEVVLHGNYCSQQIVYL